MQEINDLEAVIFDTEDVRENKSFMENFDPDEKVRKFEVSEDEIIQEDLL